ncbi:MAG: type II toxin-antitoxin system HipA family toxin [Robiginitomaculum sp.]|nr:type II toxin-antitoxin system HipA family toxin [Robiginitomaculum sp.]
MSIAPVTQIKVGLDFGSGSIDVGRLALRERTIYFEYEPEFLSRGLNISPLHLPLKPELQQFDNKLFEGLPSAFNDSLPDGWGRLLFDRAMRAQGILPQELSPLDRLAYTGRTGMGALTYEPDFTSDVTAPDINLDHLAQQAHAVLQGQSDDVLEGLLALNGSSAGARPKALIGFDEKHNRIVHGASTLPKNYAPWLVKFANAQDGIDAGATEYVYALMAREAGIDMMPCHLFDAQNGAGYFATKRSDRDGTARLHTHTACGLLHSDFRTPSLDYQDLLALTHHLTRDMREVEKMFRIAAFNVLAHNRDDHTKNFTFLMDANGSWRVSPAYDLTFSSGPSGEQSTMVMGEGKAPSLTHLQALGKEAGLAKPKILSVINQTQTALSHWESLAKTHGVRAANIRLIKNRMGAVQ